MPDRITRSKMTITVICSQMKPPIFPEDEFNSRTPWRWNAIADGFHASLYRALKPRKPIQVFGKKPPQ